MPRERVSLAEAVELVLESEEECDDEREICILPPDEKGKETEDEEEIDFSEDQHLPNDVAGTLEVNIPNGDDPLPQASSDSDRRRWRTTCRLQLSKTDDELSTLVDQYPLLSGKLSFDYLELFFG